MLDVMPQTIWMKNEKKRRKKWSNNAYFHIVSVQFVLCSALWSGQKFVYRSGGASLRYSFGFRIYLSMHSSVITVWLMALVLARRKWHHSVIVDCPIWRTNGIRWTSYDGLYLGSISWLTDYQKMAWNREKVKPLKMLNIAASLPNAPAKHVRHWYFRPSFHSVRLAQLKVLVWTYRKRKRETISSHFAFK